MRRRASSACRRARARPRARSPTRRRSARACPRRACDRGGESVFRARSAPPVSASTWKRSSSPTRTGCSGARTAAASEDAPSGVNASRTLHPVGVEVLLDLRPLIDGFHRRISIMAARWRPSKSAPNPGGRGVSEEVLRGFFREMLLIRRFEEKVEERFRAGELPGFLHVAIGQEAIATGVCAALAREDVIASTHRAHGHAIAKGTPIERIMAELYGKTEGCCGGYGGSMHLYDVEVGNLGANAVVGGGLPGNRRRGARLPDARREARRGRVLRRRRDEHRHVPRVDEPRRSSGRCRRSSSSRTTAGRSRRRRASSFRSRSTSSASVRSRTA